MVNAKQIADFVTLFRGLLGFGLVWLGLTEGAEGLQTAVFIMIAAWTGDALDGKIARRSENSYQSWIGDHDLEIDMAVSCGLLVYLITSGFVNIWLASLYVLLWTFILWRWSNLRVLGMLSRTCLWLFHCHCSGGFTKRGFVDINLGGYCNYHHLAPISQNHCPRIHKWHA